MSTLIITRPPQFTDPWFAEIEQVWDELEAANNDIESRVVTLENTIVNDVVTSISKSGDPQLQGDVTLTQSGTIVLTQVGNNIDVGGGGATDHGALTGLLDDDHTQYLLANGTRSLGGDWSIGLFQLLNMRVENLPIAPVAGNQGRLFFNTTDLRLKVDDGSAFVDVGVTDHGLLSGLADDDHPQYLLADGSRDCSGDFTVLGKYKGPLNGSMLLESQDDDAPTPIAFIMDTATLLTDPGAKLLSVRNQGVEKFSIDKDGNVTLPLITSPGSAYALIDNDNNSITEVFSVKANNTDPIVADEIFTVREDGNAWLLTALRIGSLGIPTDTLDVDGTMDISGDALFGGLIKSNSSMIFRADADNDEAASFDFQNGTGVVVARIEETGDMEISSRLRVGGLGTPTFPLNVVGDAEITGNLNVLGTSKIQSISDLVFKVDTDADESAYFRFQNDADTDVMLLDESGNLTLTGLLIGGASPFNFMSKTPANEGAAATGSITILNNVFDSGDSVTITDPSLTPHVFIETTDFAIGVDADATAINLANAITAALIGVSAVPVGPTVNLTSDLPGTYGNAFALSEFDQSTNNFSLSGANFTGGTDVSPSAYVLDTQNLFTLAGSKLFVLKNNGTEKFAIDKDGNIVSGGLSSATSVSAFIDNDNNSTSETFTVYHNVMSATPGSELFQIRENGEVEIYGGPLIGGSSPFTLISKVVDGVSSPAFLLRSQSTLATSALFTVQNNTVDKFNVNKDGNVSATGKADFGSNGLTQVCLQLGTPSQALQEINFTTTAASGRAMLSANGAIVRLGLVGADKVFEFTDDVIPTIYGVNFGGARHIGRINSYVDNNIGSGSIGFELNTKNTISGPADKLFSIKNNTVEKVSISPAGRLTLSEAIYADGPVWSNKAALDNAYAMYFNNGAGVGAAINVFTAATGSTGFYLHDGTFSSSLLLKLQPAGFGGHNLLSLENDAAIRMDGLLNSGKKEIVKIYGDMDPTAVDPGFELASINTLTSAQELLRLTNQGTKIWALTPGGKLKSMVDQTMYLESAKVAGAGAVAYIMDTTTLLSGASASLLALRNFGDAKFLVDPTGVGNFKNILYVNSGDLGNNSGVVIGNGTLSTQGVNGNVASGGRVFLYASQVGLLKNVFSMGVDGTAYISPQQVVGAGTSLFTVYNNTGGFTALDVKGNGDVTIGGTLYGGSSPFKMKSKETDGASAVAYELDTNNALSTTGAKLFSLKNNGVEKFSVDKDGIPTGGGYVTIAKPADGSLGVQAAIAAVAAAGGGIVQLLAGTYNWTGTPTTPANLKNVTVQGVGDATIIDGGGGSFNIFSYWMPDSGAKAMNNVAIGDTSIYTTTVGDAASFLVGERICIQGTDADGQFDRIWNKVKTTGNPGTGEVQLETAMPIALTTAAYACTSTSLKAGADFTMKDFRVTNFADSYAIDLQGFENVLVENIIFENQPLYIGGAIRKSYKYVVRNCRFFSDNIRGFTGIRLYDMSNVLIENCHFENMVGSPIQMTFTQDVVVRKNYIRGVSGSFSVGVACSGTGGHRMIIEENYMEKVFTSGVIVYGKDCQILNNILLDCATRTVVPAIDATSTTANGVQIIGNTVKRARWGIGSGGSRVKIIRNTIQDIYSGGATPYGLTVLTGTNNIVQDNIIMNISSYGLLAYASDSIYSGNIINTTGAPGIRSNSCARILVTNNQVRNSTGVGIIMDNSVTDSLIMGNHTNAQGITEGTGTGNDFIGNK